MTTSIPNAPRPFRVLSLDGGGAKGFYTLGVLKQVEAIVNKPLCESFDLVYGTSTGAIIAALIALGHRVDDIHALYKKHVPQVMKAWSSSDKSKALKALADSVFAGARFEDAKTGLGIVATHWMLEKPMIFKSSQTQAHGRRATFEPGFGCSISDAVQASCSAYPFFDIKTVTKSDGSAVEVFDGGYCANNPTLYAIADATRALEQAETNLRVVSVGVGVYPEPKKKGWARLKSIVQKKMLSVQLLQKTLNVNTLSMDQLRLVLFKNVPTVRIHDTFEQPEMATDFLEHDVRKLNTLYQRGGESFAKHEGTLREYLS